MKIMWLCNTMISRVAKNLGYNIYDKEGWVSGVADVLLENSNNQLIVVFPNYHINKMKKGKIENLIYYMFPKKKSCNIYEVDVENYLKTIVSEIKPDVIHVFGTEMPHALSMIKSVSQKEKVVFSIQGMVSIISEHYYSNLPARVIYGFSLRDLLKGDNIYLQKKKFEKRGKYEIEALKMSLNVIGRTDWDLSCTKNINPDINYFFCNECLRDDFYKNKWEYENCEKYSIFFGQANYPIKGFHYMLEAFNDIMKKYPTSHLYVSGPNILSSKSIKERIGKTKYAYYIEKLIRKMNMENRITFTGPLDGKEMCHRFLKSHVYISASSIENSPNSVGEAMLLGVPVITSDVGGVKNMFTHNTDGFIYQHDAPYMLSYYIDEIFQKPELVNRFSKSSREHAKITHDKSINCNTLLKIYKEIAKK